MERKSIGSFITALRKANGLTQKDLAEKLNVSDKTISRWERDENAPDLSLIPVIAEIFDVTCDELLCGERKSKAEEPATDSPRKSKQMKRILDDSLNKFKNQTYISVAITAVGVVSAMIANFGFMQARIGFFISLIFFVAAGLCQFISSNNLSHSMDSDEFDDKQLQPYKMRQFDSNKHSFLCLAVAFCAMLPLLVFVSGSYLGLSAETFFPWALIIIAVVAVVYKLLVEGYLAKIALKRGIYIETEELAKKQKLQNLKNSAAKITVGLWIMVFITQMTFLNITNAHTFVSGTRFTDLDEFVAYMELDVDDVYYDEYGAVSIAPANDSAIYYDGHGNQITEEQANTKTIEDGEGNVICTYVDNNEAVKGMTVSWKNGEFVDVTTYTQDDYQEGWRIYDYYGSIFNLGYPISAVVGIIYYIIFRKKHCI